MPPGRGARSALLPFHSTSRAGSVKNSHTSSRGAAIMTSCTMRSSRTVTAASFRLVLGPWLPLGLVRSLRDVLEALQANLPEPVQELTDPDQTGGIGGVEAPGADPVLGHQPGVAQDAEVLGDGRAGDRELLGDLPHRKLPVGDELEDAPAGRVRQSLQLRLHGEKVSIRLL